MTHIGSEIRIDVLLQLLPTLLLWLDIVSLQPDIIERILVRRIDIRLRADQLHLDVLADTLDRAEVGRDVVGALGAPGQVVQIAVGVDGQDVDVGWREEEVLDKAEGDVPVTLLHPAHLILIALPFCQTLQVACKGDQNEEGVMGHTMALKPSSSKRQIRHTCSRY